MLQRRVMHRLMCEGPGVLDNDNDTACTIYL